MMDAEDTRQRLLDAAGRKFAEKGFDATNVREITESAQTNVAAVNYYFGSKEELYVEAVRHAARTCEQLTPMPSWPGDTPPEERLRDFIRAFLCRLLRDDIPEWHRLLIMRELADPRHGACEEFVRGFARPTFEVLMGILGQLVPAGLSWAEMNLLGGSIVGQCMHYHHARHVIRLLIGPEEHGRLDLDILTEHIWRFSLAAVRGLYPRAEGGGGR